MKSTNLLNVEDTRKIAYYKKTKKCSLIIRKTDSYIVIRELSDLSKLN